MCFGFGNFTCVDEMRRAFCLWTIKTSTQPITNQDPISKNMHNKTTWHAAIFFILLTGICFARLGDTLEKCKERYGEILGTKTGAIASEHQFKKDGIIIFIHVYNNKVYKISYVKPEMTRSEAHALLEVNGILSKFKDVPISGRFESNKTACYTLVDSKGFDAFYYDNNLGGSGINQTVIWDEAISNKIGELLLDKVEKEKSDQAEKIKSGF